MLSLLFLYMLLEDGVLLEKGEGRMAVAGVKIMPQISVTMEKGGDGRTTEDSDPVGKAHGTNKRRSAVEK